MLSSPPELSLNETHKCSNYQLEVDQAPRFLRVFINAKYEIKMINAMLRETSRSWFYIKLYYDIRLKFTLR